MDPADRRPELVEHRAGLARDRRELRRAQLAGARDVALAAGLLAWLSGAADGSAAARHVTTLAVLPFVNASGDPGDEYFSDGLTKELMGRLARSDDLHIVSRTSVFALEGAGLDAREIGRMLRADALVEGSVRRDGDQLRITVHLVDSCYVPSYEVAKAYLALGRRADGEHWLLRALKQRSHSLVFLRVDPQLDAFQSTMELAGLVDRVEFAVR